jgi:microsomal dipeptidase-like Zn-dependent dipeptidase
MTVSARKWYFNYALENNIPILSSHSAANGYDTLEESHVDNNSHKNADKKYRWSTTFNNWDINLSKEEIKQVVQTGGLIGLNFDQRILTGNFLLKTLKILTFLACKQWKRKQWAKPIVNSIIEIAKTLATVYGPDDNRIWEHINLGSDFDGIINPLPAYRTVDTFKDLMPIILESLSNKRNLDILKNKTDAQIEEIVEGFQYKNALRFLSKNF